MLADILGQRQIGRPREDLEAVVVHEFVAPRLRSSFDQRRRRFLQTNSATRDMEYTHENAERIEPTTRAAYSAV
jgi:hypothetical protein